MKKVIEVSDFEMERARGFMKSNGWNNPSDNEVFDMVLDIRERIQDCSMTAEEAFFDIIY